MSLPIENRPEYNMQLKSIPSGLDRHESGPVSQLSKESLVYQELQEQHQQMQQDTPIKDLSKHFSKMQLSVISEAEKSPNSPRGSFLKAAKVNALLGKDVLKPYINFIQSLLPKGLSVSRETISCYDFLLKSINKLLGQGEKSIPEHRNFFASALKEFTYDEHCAVFLILKEFLGNKDSKAEVGFLEIAYQEVCRVLNDTAKDESKLLESRALGAEYKAIIADREAFTAFISFISQPMLSPNEGEILDKICQYQKFCELYTYFFKPDSLIDPSKSAGYNQRDFLYRSILVDLAKENGVNISNEKKKSLLLTVKTKEHGVDRFSEIVEALFEDLIPNYLMPAAPNPKHPLFSSSLQYYRLIIAKKLPFTVPLSLD